MCRGRQPSESTVDAYTSRHLHLAVHAACESINCCIARLVLRTRVCESVRLCNTHKHRTRLLCSALLAARLVECTRQPICSTCSRSHRRHRCHRKMSCTLHTRSQSHLARRGPPASAHASKRSLARVFATGHPTRAAASPAHLINISLYKRAACVWQTKSVDRIECECECASTQVRVCN